MMTSSGVKGQIAPPGSTGERRMAIITGASSGIGAAIAHRLHRDGYVVAGMDVVPPVDESREAPDSFMFSAFEICDISDRDATETAIHRVAEGHEIGLLVHCAGWTPWSKFLETDPETAERIVSVNVTGTLNVLRSVLSRMTTVGHGKIVLISSDAARTGIVGEAVYAGAKAAQIAIAKSIAVEVARDNVTINVITPGTTDTPLLRRMYTPEQIERRVKANPMRRIGLPHDIAGAVAFFSSPDSDYVTGQVLSVNGGMTRVD